MSAVSPVSPAVLFDLGGIGPGHWIKKKKKKHLANAKEQKCNPNQDLLCLFLLEFLLVLFLGQDYPFDSVKIDIRAGAANRDGQDSNVWRSA